MSDASDFDFLSIYWADSRRPALLLEPPVVGSFSGDVTPRREQAFSEDGGETWETNWVGEFTPGRGPGGGPR